MREHLLSLSVTHLHGPKRIRLLSNEAIVTCVVKNGEFYIDSFIRHYSEMGFRHIFFLDNGSTDRTISIARRYTNVSVCESRLDIETHQGLFKKYLAQQSTAGGWCLDADIDEFFDYPFSDLIGLRQFLEYLNSKKYTAVITQLLDMFSDRPLSSAAREKRENLKEVYQYYDISGPRRTEYLASDMVAQYGHRNKISNSMATLYFGGIRKTLYGSDCLLTKHSLFLTGGSLDLFPHVHFVDNARLSDVSCLMRHYKLTSNALDIALQNREGFSGNSKIYDAFIDFLIKKPDHQIKQDTAVKFRTVNDLVESGFLFTSEEYTDYVRARVDVPPLVDQTEGESPVR
jgi:hypothetical protein